MKIVSLDIATKTGIAVGVSGGDPRTWSVDLGQAPDDRRFSNVLRLAHGLIETHRPDLITVEAAIGGPKASAYLIGLVACVRGCAFNRGVRCEAVNLGSVRKHFLGKHYTTRDFPGMKRAQAKRAMKRMVMDRCRLLGWHVETDDEGDAAALWDYSCAHFAGVQSSPLGELFARAAE